MHARIIKMKKCDFINLGPTLPTSTDSAELLFFIIILINFYTSTELINSEIDKLVFMIFTSI